MGDGILLLEGDAKRGELARHFLDLMEPDADSGAAELDGVANFTDLDPRVDVVSLDFLSAAAFDAGGFVFHHGVGEDAADQPRHF